MRRHRSQILYAVCPICELVAGEGETVAELAAFPVCSKCGKATTVWSRKPGAGPRRRHGGLTRKRYLDPPTLLAFRHFMADRGAERKSPRAWKDHLIVEILSRTGLRAGELVRTAEHPDRYLRIGDVILAAGDPAIEVAKGKGCVSRVVRIEATLAALLRWYIDGYCTDEPEAPLIESEERPGQPMFYSSLNNSKCKLWAREYAESKPALPLDLSLTPHVFRHSFAIWFLTENPGMYHVLQGKLGHADLNTTTIYVHTLASEDKACTRKMQ